MNLKNLGFEYRSPQKKEVEGLL